MAELRCVRREAGEDMVAQYKVLPGIVVNSTPAEIVEIERKVEVEHDASIHVGAFSLSAWQSRYMPGAFILVTFRSR